MVSLKAQESRQTWKWAVLTQGGSYVLDQRVTRATTCREAPGRDHGPTEPQKAHPSGRHAQGSVPLSLGSCSDWVGFATTTLVSGLDSQLPPCRCWPPPLGNTRRSDSQASHQMTFMLFEKIDQRFLGRVPVCERRL